MEIKQSIRHKRNLTFLIDENRGINMNVFLCENIHHEALKRLKSRATVLSDWSQIEQADAIINRNLQLTKERLEVASRCKVIAIHGTGTDGVDLAEARKREIDVFSTPHQNGDSVAELIVGVTLDLARKISLAQSLVRGKEPYENAPACLQGMELRGKTVGFIGMGDIAMRAAAIFREGFSMNVLGYSPSSTDEKAEFLGYKRADSILEIFKKADIISVNIPLTKETTHLITREEFMHAKPTAYFINTSRGKVVRESDLYEALTKGYLKGAALDVFEVEPPTYENPLVMLPNVIATPHIGANTEEALYRVGMAVVEGIFNRLG